MKTRICIKYFVNDCRFILIFALQISVGGISFWCIGIELYILATTVHKIKWENPLSN